MSGEDTAGPPNSSSQSLCQYHQAALQQKGVTDHDIDLAAAHGMDCLDCRLLVGNVLQERINALEGR